MFENLTPRGSLPSLTGLRAFEAMGRTGSATRAAAELHVTHSAVSRQVKALEAALGIRLFEGPKHRLTLTEPGRTLLAGLTESFDGLAAAVRQVRERDVVRLAVHPSLAVKWLVPRLADFEARHPEVSLLLSELELRAVRQRGADLVLRYVDADQLDEPGLDALVENRIGLVCAPALSDRLETAPRLTTRTREHAWSDWETASGRSAPLGRNRTLAHLHMVVDAAVAGLGAAVLPWGIVEDEIAAGRLIAPFGFLPDGGVMAAIRGPGAPTRSERIVMRWLRDQARRTRT
ncbi:LysR substrate-binding domain-containing protein [Brevundimonas sp.]|uniref:LysR substrate-binding domain-containing protein n=1 Tax=Brevundimonas sp. TaxID=1871086 RepID=UPI003F7215D4